MPKSIIQKKMKFALNIALCAMAVLACCEAAGAEKNTASRRTTMLVGDMLNFALPNFNDESGLKEWELFGDKATYVDESRIDIQKMRLNLFDQKSLAGKARAEITSDLALVNPTTKFVSSKTPLQVKADEFLMNGNEWNWDGSKKIVSVFKNVKIDFFGEVDEENFTKSPAGKLEKSQSQKKSQNDITKVFSDFASLDHADKNNIFKLAQNVKVVSSDMTIDCDQMIIDAPKNGGGAREISAQGNVKLQRDKLTANSQSALVVPSKSTALMKGAPQIFDASSKATLSGDTIFLDKSSKSVKASSSKTLRARTILLNADKNGTEQTIVISADEIEMKELDKAHSFDFKGNVQVVTPDFIAYCGEMSALAKSGDKSAKGEVELIKGSQNVKFINKDGEARANNMEIFPKKSEVWLNKNASLKDAERGTLLKCDVIVFQRDKNSGIALSDSKVENSFVTLQINDDISALQFQNPQASQNKNPKTKSSHKSAKKSPSIVRSKILQFSKEDQNMFFTFLKEVRIDSDSTIVTCSKMDVMAKSDKKGSAKLNKIVASENVRLVQKGYKAQSELATIYPKLEMQSDDNKTSHRYVELSTDPSNPLKRPLVSLPAMGNLGLDSALASNKNKTDTVIKSDKQWLMSSKSGVDKYFFEGNVIIEGTDLNGECDKIEVIMKAKKGSSEKQITQIIMRNNVKMKQALKEVECGRADFYVDEEMIVLSENPAVSNKQDNTRVEAPRIVYNKGQRKVIFDANSVDTPPVIDDSETTARPTMILPSMQNLKKKDDVKTPSNEAMKSYTSPEQTQKKTSPKNTMQKFRR